MLQECRDVLLDDRFRNLMESYSFIFTAYILKAEENRKFWPACQKELELYRCYTLYLWKEVNYDPDILFSVAFVKGINHNHYP